MSTTTMLIQGEGAEADKCETTGAAFIAAVREMQMANTGQAHTREVVFLALQCLLFLTKADAPDTAHVIGGLVGGAIEVGGIDNGARMMDAIWKAAEEVVGGETIDKASLS